MIEIKDTPTPRPWTDATVIKVDPGETMNLLPVTYRPLSEENWQYAKHCVNTYEEREALLKEMAELLQKVANDDASCMMSGALNSLIASTLKKYKSHTS